MADRAYSSSQLYSSLFAQAWPYWPYLVAFGILNLLAAPLALIMPIPLKIAIDSVVGSTPLPAAFHVLPAWMVASKGNILAVSAAMLIAVTISEQVQSFGAWLLQTYVGEKLLLDFRARLFRQVQRLSFSYHDAQGTAQSTYRIQNDAAAIQSIAVTGVVPFVSAAFTLVAMVYVVARIDWQLAAIALVTSPLMFLLLHTNLSRIRNRWKEVKKLDSLAMAVVQETLSSLRVVKAFTREAYEEERFVFNSQQRLRGQLDAAMLQSGFDVSLCLLIAVATAASLYIGVRHVNDHRLTLGSLMLVMGYLTQLYTPLRTISKKITELQSSLASAERAFALLDEVPDVSDKPNAKAIARARGSIEFRNVSFAYGSRDEVLHDISLRLEAGSTLGISGVTGAGKTTMLALLMRFYDPAAGTILLDGIDIRDLKLNDLRNQFAILHQEAVLFSTTIAENIAYGRPGASEREIVQAARAAHAHDFITRLPRGYETLVGERGISLSGGERQRVALARAFLKDAPILLLDEPTSSVDVKTEAVMMQGLELLMRGRTTFMVAHRLSTLDSCDVRVHLERGKLTVLSQSAPSAVTARSARV
jgi:ATP-binding cassette, subfamily B, bacterial